MRVYVLGLAAASRSGDVAMRMRVIDVRVVGSSVDSDVVIRELAHLRIINTEDLRLFGGAQTEAGNEVHDPEDDGLKRAKAWCRNKSI